MTQEIIDLSKQTVAAHDWDKMDVILLATTGGVGYLAREAFRYFFPATPSVTEQMEALTRLIESAGKVGVKKLKVRMSADASITAMLPDSVKGKVTSKRGNAIDLELTFA